MHIIMPSTVCRELVLICSICKKTKDELHCEDHFYLKSCYFTNLSSFSSDDLKYQLHELELLHEQIAVGKSFKQKRRTLKRQMEKLSIQLELSQINGNKRLIFDQTSTCRHCMMVKCNGECWGFHGLARAKVLDHKLNAPEKLMKHSVYSKVFKTRSRLSANQRASKVTQKAEEIEEIIRLGLFKPPSCYRNSVTGIRCPPPCTRSLKTSVKGKWCGKAVMDVLKDQFVAFKDDALNDEMLKCGLILINDMPINAASATTVALQNMDIVSRIIHWHEPPVIVPETIQISKFDLSPILNEKTSQIDTDSTDNIIYVCEKPSSVPVHPTGPYLFNTLTLLIEAQLGLDPRTLYPCHRLDRVTSGIVLCCTSQSMIRLMQSKLSSGAVSKMYLARVCGRFPRTKDQCSDTISIRREEFATWKWQSERSGMHSIGYISICAKINTIDPANGIRGLSASGKESQTKVAFLSYDETLDLSTVLCLPVSGRSHQIRVHLQWLGFPIHNDVQYGGSVLSSNRNVSINAIESIIRGNEVNLENNRLTPDVLKAAKDTCTCCGSTNRKDAITRIKASFSSSQLLQEGQYAIDLHAMKYQLKLERLISIEKPGTDKSGQRHVDLYTGVFPNWAKNISMDDLKFF